MQANMNQNLDRAVALKPLLLQAKDAAAFLSISPRTLWEFSHNGGIPTVRIGRRVLYNVESLRRWAQERERSGGVSGENPSDEARPADAKGQFPSANCLSARD
jgi:hypothetical protein